MTTAAANSTTTGTLPANTLLRVLGASIVTITRNGAVVATQSTERDNFVGPYPTETSYSVVAGGASIDIRVKDGEGVSDALVPAKFSTDASGNTVVLDADGRVIIRPVVSYTWANRPAAAGNEGVVIRITDIGGTAGSRWISDGAYWKPESGRVVLGGSGEGITGPLDTVENSFGSFVLPGYAMGPNGCLNIVTTWSYTNSANNKVLRIRFGAMDGERLVDSTQTTSASLRMWTEWQNRNRVDQQAGGTAQSNSLLAGGIGGAAFTSAQDTTVDKTIFITGQKATGAESLILMRWVAELIVP